MPHAFDLSGLTHLLGGLKVVAERAREHEYQLTELVSSTEATTPSALASPTSDAVAATATGIDVMPPLDSMPAARLMMTLRELCVAARDQRLRAEQLVANVGGGIDDGGTGPSDHNVLVVDDSEDSRELAATVLDGAGFRVLTATNGLEAIIAAHVTLPSAILMDITMPVLNGIEAARLLKASPVTRDIHVLAYTANAGFYDGPLSHLFADVLAKPAHPDAIAQLLRQAIYGRRNDG
jgi:CheY-like chemotaxis protein